MRPTSYLFLILAGIVIFFFSFVMYNMVSGSSTGINFGIGVGGMERMVAFPTIFWALATGIYLVGRADIDRPVKTGNKA